MTKKDCILSDIKTSPKQHICRYSAKVGFFLAFYVLSIGYALVSVLSSTPLVL